jgi:hypothetical protein
VVAHKRAQGASQLLERREGRAETVRRVPNVRRVAGGFWASTPVYQRRPRNGNLAGAAEKDAQTSLKTVD